jgi:serine/threonine protein kinase
LPALVVEKASEAFPTLDMLLQKRTLCGVEKADLLAGIADGLGAIHVSNVTPQNMLGQLLNPCCKAVSLCHGDLKPANILIFTNEQNSTLTPKLSDFAFSRSWKEPKSSGGTEYWNAPECCELRSGPIGDPRSPLRDHFSLGLVFWNVFRNELPFDDIAAEGDSSIEKRRRVQTAKESGHLLDRLATLKQSENYVSPLPFSDLAFILTSKTVQEAFLFESENISDTADNDDAILSIVETLDYLLQPVPERRQRQYVHLPTELR